MLSSGLMPSKARAIRTVDGHRETSFRATLPSKNDAIPPKPRLPITTRWASFLSTNSMRVSAASPSKTTASASKPFPRSRSVASSANRSAATFTASYNSVRPPTAATPPPAIVPIPTTIGAETLTAVTFVFEGSRTFANTASARRE